MSRKDLENPLDEQLESSSTEEDLVSDGDAFEMNLAEKSDVDLFSEPVDSKKPTKQKKKTPSKDSLNETLTEHEASTATTKDMEEVSDYDYYEMNLVEKSDINPYDVNIEPSRRIKDSSRNDDWEDKDS